MKVHASGIPGFLAGLILISLSHSVVGDSVIETRDVEMLEAGDFEDESLWEITNTRGFSQEVALHTIGMVADSELSFTHSRPDNFDEFTAWASTSPTGSSGTLGEADDVYTWSIGPNISMGGYFFDGLHDYEIEEVSLVLHFSIPDVLNEDEVNVLLQNHGADILVTTYVRTLSAVNRMTNPLVLSLDGLTEWNWENLEGTQFTVDYISENEGTELPRDSEVRVDAAGLRVKFHQPWYSFENSKAIHSIAAEHSPVIEFGPYDGDISGLIQSTCGLMPDGSDVGSWNISVETPPEQSIGRIHVIGTGNYTIWASNAEGGFDEAQSGEILTGSGNVREISIEVEDGCIEGAKVDINDPKLLISGSIAGSVSGLSQAASYIRFAVGGVLVHSEDMEIGQFSISIPVGHALPKSGDELEIGVAARFQWSSNGTAETTVVHINSISISGGYEVDWDYDPTCSNLEDLHFVEDEGGQIIPISSRCSDDITSSGNLTVFALSSNPDIVEASGDGNLLRIQPMDDSHGSSLVEVVVSDESGNSWEGEFTVNVQPIEDPPSISDLPLAVYIDLGDTLTIEPLFYDSDSDVLEITTSKSWASVGEGGSISLTPVDSGTHNLTITVSDGENQESQSMEVIVTAKPDLVVESIELRIGTNSQTEFIQGDVIEIAGFVRNEGRGSASDIQFQCTANGLLVDSGTIQEISPGELKIAVCDTQLIDSSNALPISLEIDSTNSIDEVSEENNAISVQIIVESPDSGSGDSGNSFFLVASLLVILASIAAFQLGPRPLKREFEKIK
ncbi:MAG: CARDB domain-containing protein [Candidatus Thermoplasmatota archaeon]|nr:CARDB domain-containing protein [Candidatus Thermoplasmatota archaeon]